MVVSHELELREYMLQHLEQFQHQLWLELEQCRNRKVDEVRHLLSFGLPPIPISDSDSTA